MSLCVNTVFVARIIKIIVLHVFSVFQTSLTCKAGWHFFCNSCYTIVRTTSSWYAARDHCASVGGHLAAITSARENDFLAQLMGNISNVWIGAHGSGSSFKWDGGNPWSFSAFRSNWSAPYSNSCVELFNSGF